MKQFYIIIILTFHTTFSFACLNTYQFKIFPVGVSNDGIITIDIQIYRTSELEGNRRFNLDIEKPEVETEMWILYSYLSSYDKNQKLLSLTPLDTTYSLGSSYSDTLHSAFQRGLSKIKTDFVNIDYFQPTYISFCDFQQKCDSVTIQYNSVSKRNYVVYEGRKHKVSILTDSTYYAFSGRSYHPDSITELFINSIRVYETKAITLVVTHLATGDEISLGYITSDPKKAGKTDEGEIVLAKEYKPKLAFLNLDKTTYEEPLLHHGYGFDIFVVKTAIKNKK